MAPSGLPAACGARPPRSIRRSRWRRVPGVPGHAESIAGQRFTAKLIDGFALGALLIAATGICGVLASSGSRRTHEFRMQMALGASPEGILRNVLRYGTTLVGVGLGVGVVGGFAVKRFLGAPCPN